MAKRGGKRRDPAREKFWRRTIRRQQQSGLTIRAFCQREGLKDWTLRWWRQELARRDQQPSPDARRHDADGQPAEAAPVFLPVRVVGQETVPPQPPPPIEILLPTGPTVRVPGGFDPSTLRAILTILEGRPC
jgi:hypothetical protein